MQSLDSIQPEVPVPPPPRPPTLSHSPAAPAPPTCHPSTHERSCRPGSHPAPAAPPAPASGRRCTAPRPTASAPRPSMRAATGGAPPPPCLCGRGEAAGSSAASQLWAPGPRQAALRVHSQTPAPLLFSLTTRWAGPASSSLSEPHLGTSPRPPRRLSAAVAGQRLRACATTTAATEVASSQTHGGVLPRSAPASAGAHPMARGLIDGWLAAEVVAWAV